MSAFPDKQPDRDEPEIPELPENVERLVSRFLDDEVSDEERRQLEEFLKRNRGAEPAVDEYFEIERETRTALRKTFGASVASRRRAIRWNWASRIVTGSIAACIVMLSVSRPQPAASVEPGVAAPQSASWFSPLPPMTMGDMLVEPDDAGDRAHIHIDKSDRNWIIVPGDAPGEFLVVEVKQTKRRTIAVHQDY
ncbi:MAG: hypothetical protein ACKVS9_02845 [Phycisphaerae bacterium]